MPWPTRSRTTLKPAASTTACTAAPMSPRWLPGTRGGDARAASDALRHLEQARGLPRPTAPTATVVAESVK